MQITTLMNIPHRNNNRILTIEVCSGGMQKGGRGITIVYYGKMKDGDKFMDDWNNNGRILWSEITPRQVKDLYEYVCVCVWFCQVACIVKAFHIVFFFGTIRDGLYVIMIALYGVCSIQSLVCLKATLFFN